MATSRIQNGIRRSVGGVLLLAGVSVFLIRLQHAGPFAMPAGGNLLSALLALVLGLALLTPRLQATGKTAPLIWLGIAASPVILFFALYATLAELEEVISIKAVDRQGKPANLRLWVVDYEGRPWVTMPAAKSDNHGLENGPVVMLRQGAESCVLPKRFDERGIVDDIHRRRHEKYRIQRLATLVGLFGETAGENTVTLRLDPCADQDSQR